MVAVAIDFVQVIIILPIQCTVLLRRQSHGDDGGDVHVGDRILLVGLDRVLDVSRCQTWQSLGAGGEAIDLDLSQGTHNDGPFEHPKRLAGVIGGSLETEHGVNIVRE